MAQRRIITDWELGEMFGAGVIRGRIDGQPVMALFRWCSNNRFGIAWSGMGTEETVRVGRPAPSEAGTLCDVNFNELR